MPLLATPAAPTPATARPAMLQNLLSAFVRNEFERAVKHGSDVDACLCPVEPYLIIQRASEGAVNIYRSYVQGVARGCAAAYNATN
jgi:hypothetical protein